ncbi:hypothetical protein BD309DRAFT_980366 [Dichomitus squalens]|uniref:Uncharacterized protein n=1 Tax=Dichomitus squalens TaxID=114155 RepID=A0A4Q9NWD0_9APHY|nr:hypothetical protein BD309DRAFT_980366 [Dichomitus squalens]TBU53708.1 hypothetical protein BD310DRAFT_909318 [Dichomitus squalens]
MPASELIPTILDTSFIPSLDGSLGASLLGTFFGLILYGIVLVQFYKYCRAFLDDAPLIRSIVIGVMVLETLHATFTMHYTYVFLVTDYFNPLALENGTCNPLNMQLNALIARYNHVSAPLPGGYTRVGKPSERDLVDDTDPIAVGSIYSIIASISMVLLLFDIPLSIYLVHRLLKGNFASNLVDTKWIIGVPLLMACIIDTLLTSILVVVLRWSRSGLKR